MRVELFWAVWGPLSAWRREHAQRVRRNRLFNEKVRAYRRGILQSAFSAWKDDEAVQLRRTLAVFAPVPLPFVMPPRFGAAIAAFWVFYGAETVILYAEEGEVSPASRQGVPDVPLALTDAPSTELVPLFSVGWSTSWERAVSPEDEDEDGST